MTKCGIYKITNLTSGKSYIGQSNNIPERWKKHRYASNLHSRYELYQDFAKYGLDNFDFSILCECSSEELDEKEIYWIAFYDTYYNGYNQTKGGSNSSHPVKISEEDLEIIIKLLQESTLTQREIAELFEVGNDTISEINQGKSRYNENLTYPLRDNQKHKHSINYCKDCGAKIGLESTYCIACSNRHKGYSQRKIPSTNTPSREELKILLRTSPFTKIGEQYGVSDNAVRKWCDKYGLPRKASEIKKIPQQEWDLI